MKVKVKSYIIAVLLGIFTIPGLSVLINSADGSVSALDYQTTADVDFTINPSITVSLSSSDLVIDELSPGTNSDSNNIVVNVLTNNISGYYLSSTVGNSSYTSTDLIHNTSGSNVFTSLNTSDSLASLTTPGTWGYSYSNDSGTTWSSYSGLPLYTNAGVKLSEKYVPSDDDIGFKIAAYATNTQASGEYNNVINFIATAYPYPMNLSEAYAYFNKQQVDGYYTMQDMTPGICAVAEDNSTMQAMDLRDHSVYTIAKLADHRCWMTENLDIAGGTALNSDTTDVTSDYIDSFATSNNLTKADGAIVLPASSISGFDTDDYSYVYNSGNKTSNCSTLGCYSYYSWDAATLGSGRSMSIKNENAPFSICPKNWHLPTTYDGIDSSTDLKALAIALGGSSSIQTYNASTEPTGNAIYASLKASPYSFLLAGNYYQGAFYSGNSYGNYWTATVGETDNQSYYLDVGQNRTILTSTYYFRMVGRSVRCIASN